MLIWDLKSSTFISFFISAYAFSVTPDANVASFGEYLQDYKNKSQFIVITHKKKTMEYANTLYGITMQESGVSKLVSVRLEDK